MSLNSEILKVIDNHIDSQKDKNSKLAVTLTTLKNEIRVLITEESAKSADIAAYQCRICRNISLNLVQSKYCLQCFDLFVD